MKRILLVLAGILIPMNLLGQILKPVKWSYAARKISETEAVVLIKASIGDGWHIYSTRQKAGGPVKTTITFFKGQGYDLSGKLIEPKPITQYEKNFGINVNYFEHEVVFQQRMHVSRSKLSIKGRINFMVCNDQKCLPPEDVGFTIPVR
jgi:hypothetical protein